MSSAPHFETLHGENLRLWDPPKHVFTLDELNLPKTAVGYPDLSAARTDAPTPVETGVLFQAPPVLEKTPQKNKLASKT